MEFAIFMISIKQGTDIFYEVVKIRETTAVHIYQIANFILVDKITYTNRENIFRKCSI